MAVSGTMALTANTLREGGAAVIIQRGFEVWGANYLYASGGIQNDIQIISDEVKRLDQALSGQIDMTTMYVEYIYVDNDAVVSGEMKVYNESNLGNVDVSGTLTASGLTTLGGILSSSYDAYVQDLNASGNVNVTSGLLPDVSGVGYIGTSNAPIASGITMVADDGTIVQLRAINAGVDAATFIVSGVATGHALYIAR